MKPTILDSIPRRTNKDKASARTVGGFMRSSVNPGDSLKVAATLSARAKHFYFDSEEQPRRPTAMSYQLFHRATTRITRQTSHMLGLKIL